MAVFHHEISGTDLRVICYLIYNTYICLNLEVRVYAMQLLSQMYRIIRTTVFNILTEDVMDYSIL